MVGILPRAQAQAVGSKDVVSGYIGVQNGGELSNSAETLVIGPGTYVIDGTWNIYSKYIWICPDAIISGAGTMKLHDPLDAGGATAANNIDGNNSSNLINLKIDMRNANGVLLADIADPSAGAWTDSAANASLRLDSQLNFGVVANITLGNYNLALGNGATLNAAAADRYVVTNGTGLLVKQGIATATGFTFPVGQAASDYTPVLVTNTSGSTRTYNVQVKDYTGSGATESNTTKAMARTWQVYADASGTATVALSHNSPSSDGASFTNTAAYVSQQLTAGTWSISTSTADGGTAVSTHTSASVTIPAAATATSYFSKTSDQINALNSFIAVSAKAFLQGAYSTSTHLMSTSLRGLAAFPLTQPYNFSPFSYAGTETVAAVPASVTDWVLVELRDPVTPTTIIARRAAFIKNNGDIVDVDGSSAVSFRGVAAGNYHIAIKHRNHLAIRTATAQAFAIADPVPYNFTDDTAKAYRNGALANANMKTLETGVYGMWGGNANSNTVVNYGALGSDRVSIRNTAATVGAITRGLGAVETATATSIYSNNDLNMNGILNYGALGSDRLFLRSNVLSGTETKVITQH